VSAVQTVPEVVADDQLRDRGAFVAAVDPDGGCLEQVGQVLAGTDVVPEPTVIRPANETDTAELLQGAGFGADQIAALRERGVIA
jgi:crotonobetainyl-CoA:carnitine CoA-transferase CaiB-like acyl-CoA transferase